MMNGGSMFEAHLSWSPDYYDLKVVEGPATLKEFVAAFLSYRPTIIQYAYRFRRWQMGVMGFELDLDHADDQLTAETLPLTPGEKATFFDIIQSDGESFWIGDCPESHLKAALGVIAVPLPSGMNRFEVGTAVQYLGWKGRLEFNVVRPFHHWFVRTAMNHCVVPQK